MREVLTEAMTTMMKTMMMTSKHLRVRFTSAPSSLKPPDSFQPSPSHFFFLLQLDMCSPEYLHVCFIFIVIVSSSFPPRPKLLTGVHNEEDKRHNRKSLAAPLAPSLFPTFSKSSFCNSSRFIPSNRSEHHPFT